METAPDGMPPSIHLGARAGTAAGVKTWEKLPARLRQAFLIARASFRPGEEVLLSGIYECKHADGERTMITLIRGSRFPQCEGCGSQLSYRLTHEAPYIYEDPDFKT